MTYSAHDRERWVAEDRAQKLSDRDDFARDRARLLHSSALRRLSAKTQVVAPSSDDFVRNRLTHSLEVAQIGREIGAALGCNPDVVGPPASRTTSATRRSGTTASRRSSRGGRHRRVRGQRPDPAAADRLEAKRSHADGRPAGLNLTRASLDATTKYPWRRGDGPTPTTKFGVYDDDLDVFTWFRADARRAAAPSRPR